MKRKPVWLKSEMFSLANPHPFRITDLQQTTGKFGNEDYLLFVSSELSGDIIQLSLWGKNLNILIDKFGEDSTNWNGKKISIAQEQDVTGKDIRIIKPI